MAIHEIAHDLAEPTTSPLVHIIRHGQSLHNVDRGYPHRDPPLTDTGHEATEQIKDLGRPRSHRHLADDTYHSDCYERLPVYWLSSERDRSTDLARSARSSRRYLQQGHLSG